MQEVIFSVYFPCKPYSLYIYVCLRALCSLWQTLTLPFFCVFLILYTPSTINLLFCLKYVCATIPHTFCSFPQVSTQSVGVHCQTPVTQWLVRQPLEVHSKWGDHAGLTLWTTVPPSGGRMNHRMDRTQEGQPKKEIGGLLLQVELEQSTNYFNINLYLCNDICITWSY